MRVLHTIPGITAVQGGLQTALMNLCRAQRAAGITPEIATLDSEGLLPDPAFAAFSVHEFPCVNRFTGRSPAMREWLKARADDYDAVIAHSLWRDPVIYSGASSRLVVMAHGMLDPDALARHALRKLWRGKMVLPGLLRQAVVVYTCEAERERAQDGPGRHARAGRVIPLPVDVPKVPAPLPDTGPVVTLGLLHPRKGQLAWVRALRLLRERGLAFQAVYAGAEGDAGYAYRVHTEASGVAEYAGTLTYAKALELQRAALVVCAPCVVRENFGMVMAEAMAQGRPVVAGRPALMVPGLEAAGVLRGADPEPESLADAIERLLKAPQERVVLAKAGHHHAATHWHPSAVGNQWKALVESLAS
jgi:glycosyltransferase involved in cell wall biosynthesis